jgi:molecular chaperone GrpE
MSENDDAEDNSGPDAPPPAADGPVPESLASAAEPAPATPSPAARVAALEAEKAECKDRMLRIAAEFDNYKKRTRKDMAEHEQRARETVLRDFLEVADNLERAIASWNEGGEADDIKSVQNGVELVLRLFKSKLERYSVTAIEARGQPFDPRVHDAISQSPSAEATPGTVLRELQKGYRVGERLLRPAVVVVAVAPPAPPSEPSRSDESEAQTAQPPAGGVDIDLTGDDEQPSKGGRHS